MFLRQFDIVAITTCWPSPLNYIAEDLNITQALHHSRLSVKPLLYAEALAELEALYGLGSGGEIAGKDAEEILGS